MIEYKIDIENSLRALSKVEKIKVMARGQCYDNSFYTLKALNSTQYKFCVGYLKRKIKKEEMLFRHGFVLDELSEQIIDVTIVKNSLPDDLDDIRYFPFKILSIEEYTDFLLDGNKTCLSSMYHEEEKKVLNELMDLGLNLNLAEIGDSIQRLTGYKSSTEYCKAIVELGKGTFRF